MSRAAATLLCLLVALAGCPEPAAPATSGTSTSGTAVVVEGVRPRVVTSSPALSEMICAIGGQAHLVGVSRYCVHPPALQALPQIGGAIDPNLEAIDALAPDLILVQGRDERLLELVAQRPACVLETFRVETVAEALAATARLGELLGRRDEARAEIARLEDAFARARAERPAAAVKTLVVFGHRPGELSQLSAPGSGTFVTDCLVLAGGESCLADLPAGGWHVLSLEAVLERAPDLIVELSPDPVDAATARALRADWAVLSDVPAVRAGRIAIVSGSEVLSPGPRLDRLVTKLARAVRGELDVSDEVR